MTILPVAHRELRVAARQPRTYYVRTLTAAVAFIVVGYASVYARVLGAGTGGRGLFLGLSMFVAWICLLTGVSATADAISRERREGTLGFLFLSHLSGFEVVLGKLLAQATHAFYALLSVMPLLALPFLDGGVTPGEFWWTMLALTNTLFFAVCLGLFTSAGCHDPRQATNFALVGAIAFWLGPTGLAALAGGLQWPAWIGRACYELSPLTACALGAGGPASLGRALASSHAEAWLFLVGASYLTGRAWRERPAGAVRSRWQDWRRRLVLGSPVRRAARRRRLLDRGAFFWLIARHRWKPLLPHLLLGFLIAMLGVGWWVEGGSWPPVPLAVILGGTAHLLLKFFVAGEAAAAIANHRRAGTLELLLSTPLTVRDIVRAQFQSARWQFGIPLLTTAALTLGFPLAMTLGGEETVDGHALTVVVLAVIALFADTFTLVWLASWRAIAARRIQHSAGSAVLRVLVLPWVVLLVVWPFLHLGGLGDTVAVWAVVGFGCDFIWWQWARNRLLERFRVEAGRLHETMPGGRWERWMNRVTAR